jgi:serine/threonine-protein kinase HipA
MNLAKVKLWGKLVGAVAWDESAGYATFEFDAAFKKLDWDVSPIKMSIYENQRLFSFPELRKKSNASFDTFKGLPGFLADALPDRYGSQLINMWLAQQGRPQNSMNPVEMLCFIGTRGMGALEFEPTVLKESKRSFSVEMESLVDISQRLLNQKEQFVTNLNKDEEKAILEILTIGTSARPKA